MTRESVNESRTKELGTFSTDAPIHPRQPRRHTRQRRMTRRRPRGRKRRSRALDDDEDEDEDDVDPRSTSKDVALGRRRSARARGRPRKKYHETNDEEDFDDDDDDEFAIDDEKDLEEEEEEEEESDDDEPVRRSARTRGKVARLSPRWRARDDEEEEDASDDDETDEEDVKTIQKSYPRRARGPPPERYSPPKVDGEGKASDEGAKDVAKARRGLFENRPAWANDGKQSKRASKRSRRQSSGRWIDDSDNSDEGDFNLGAGALDGAFKAPPPYPLAGAGPSAAQNGGAEVNAEITPIAVDPTLTFDAVGGLDKYVDALKEMVFLPLLYPEVFARFKMSPPRGVLLYGAPGTGKTLIARALAASCSRAGSEVAFFMRKGADVLSKWVGESERQLRLLFEEAQKRQPAIIFFDELDGLAPVRSSKTDQIHNSLVATLLALMDGLDNRGRVVVLGATNRVDSIDGALRRPGRFDRELAFPLPGIRARGDILRIHTRAWEQQPSSALIDDLAAKCVGYCGADLKALCTEAAVHALRRRYPQIYESDERLTIDPKQVTPNRTDFRAALAAIVPASHRAARTHARPLTPLQKPLLERVLEECLETIRRTFPPAQFITLEGDGEAVGVNSGARQLTDSIAHDEEDDDDALLARASGDDGGLGDAKLPSESAATAALEFMRRPPCQRTALCIHGEEGSGYTQMASALLHALEQFPVHAVGMPSLLGDSGRSPEEALVTAVIEARRAAPSILFLPEIRLWWESSTPTLRAALTTLLRDIPTDLPVMVIATADVADVEELEDSLRASFASVRWRPIAMPKTFTREALMTFFRPLCDAAFNVAQRRDVVAERGESVDSEKGGKREREVLARASSAPNGASGPSKRAVAAKISEATIATENHALRQQRMFLRDVVTRLLYKKMWTILAAPITDDDLEHYSERVTEPMDLSTLLWKVDSEMYTTIDAFLDDVHLITRSAHQYWGESTDDVDGRQMLSKAHALEDTIAQMVSALDPQLVMRCKEIDKARAERSSSAHVRDRAAPDARTKPASSEAAASGEENSAEKRISPKGAPVWQNPDFVRDPEKMARELKKRMREQAAALENGGAIGECEPMDDDGGGENEANVVVAPRVVVDKQPASIPRGPPAKSDKIIATMKDEVTVKMADAAKSYDFTRLENVAGDLARVAKSVAASTSSDGTKTLRSEALREALLKNFC